eukprot:TRINITY_DN8223_c0_g1_i1.p1 TRINITY_DN8223_c0_g1~~TRINITY_DN8223_c0_g1_i1.p1  ORF type:complete len:496 (+),score=99.90 TRINITY_DN8223_c0_g1_i1:62-1489(+)
MHGTGAAVLALLAVAAVVATEDAPVLLQPVSSAPADAPERMLILFQGAGVPAADYEATAQAVQRASQLRLWVGIPQFPLAMPDPLLAAQLIEQVQQLAREQGFPGIQNGDCFLAGHSLGGIVAQNTIPADFAGLVLLGAYLPLDGAISLFNFSHPVLTLGGELDGLTRMTRIAEAYGQFLALSVGNSKHMLSKKPVLLIPGVSHSQFCNITVSGDLYPEVPDDVAHKEIGELVAAFLSLQVNTSDFGAYELLVEQNVTTSQLSVGWLHASSIEKTEWCAASQYIMSGLSDPEKEHFRGTCELYTSLKSFEDSKPELQQSPEGWLEATSCVFLSYHTPMDISTFPVSATEVSVKMKSTEAIAEQLGVPAPQEQTCKHINEQAVIVAAQLANPNALTRYTSKGKPLALLQDTTCKTGLSWTLSSLSFSEGDTNCTVSSPALFVATSSRMFPGMHYCKLLSPAKVLEWMLVDSLPHTP